VVASRDALEGTRRRKSRFSRGRSPSRPRAESIGRHCCRRGSSRHGGGARLPGSCLRLDLDRQAGTMRTARSDSRRTPPRHGVVVLDQDRVGTAQAMVRRAAARTAYSPASAARLVLRVSRMVIRPPAASTNRRARLAMRRGAAEVERGGARRRAARARTPVRPRFVSPAWQGLFFAGRSCSPRTERFARLAESLERGPRARPARSRPSTGTRRAPSAPAARSASV